MSSDSYSPFGRRFWSWRTVLHFTRPLWIRVVLVAVAAALCARHLDGTGMVISATCAWIVLVLLTVFSGMHDWTACTWCARPPRHLATEQARARTARLAHSKTHKLVTRIVLWPSIIVMFLPRSAQHLTSIKILAAVLIFTAGLLMLIGASAELEHKRHREECHLEWCRAGLERKPGERALSPRHLWLAHYGVWVIAVLAPAALTLALLNGPHPHGLMKDIYTATVFVMGITMLDVLFTHTHEPCLHCVRSLPASGEEAAEQRMRWLRLFHVTQFKILTVVAISWVASLALAGSIEAKALICIAAVGTVIWAILHRLHSPVRPWCPWCKDDGDEDEFEDVPDPSTNIPAPA